MKKVFVAILLVVFAFQAFAIALPKDVNYPGKKLAPSVFSHKTHADDAGLKCASCHPLIFPKKKAHANKITMGEINKGKFCGTCHKKAPGEKDKAFSITKCKNCHIKIEKKADTEEDEAEEKEASDKEADETED